MHLGAQKDDVKVSIVVSVYKVEKYLEACLESLINQTFRNIESICVDDCSLDDSSRIMRAFAERDPRIKNIFLERNAGVSAARNRGFQEVTWDYTLFQDSDDILALDAVEKLYQVATMYNADLVQYLPKVLLECDYDGFSKYYKDYPEELTNTVFSGWDLFTQMLQKGSHLPAVWLKFLKSDMIRKHDLAFVEGYVHEDILYSVKIMTAAKRCVLLNERLYIRWVREGSIMTSRDPVANLAHSCGYAAAIGMLQAEIRDGIYEREQQSALNMYSARLYSVMYQYSADFTPEERDDLLKELGQCPGNENWDFLFAVTDLFRKTIIQQKITLAQRQETINQQKTTLANGRKRLISRKRR